MIDTHCHLSDLKFKNDWQEVVEKAVEGGIELIILPTENLRDAVRAIELSRQNKYLKVAIGFYPGSIRKEKEIGTKIEQLERLIGQEKDLVVAIGEIGLDKYWLERRGTVDKKLFKAQLELAVKLKLPAVIHQRETEKEIEEIMKSLKELPKGHFHCWSGSDKFLRYVLKRGFYVGFCGNITYKSNDQLRDQAKRTPLEKILIETDSPYLPPKGKRGQRNEPINVKMVATTIAQVKKMMIDRVEKATTENARKLYRL